MSAIARTPEKGNVTTHEATILPIRFQSIEFRPNATIPTAVTAPIWQCVVDTGSSSTVAITTWGIQKGSVSVVHLELGVVGAGGSRVGRRRGGKGLFGKVRSADAVLVLEGCSFTVIVEANSMHQPR